MTHPKRSSLTPEERARNTACEHGRDLAIRAGVANLIGQPHPWLLCTECVANIIADAEAESYAAGFEAGAREMRERAAGFVHSTDLLIRIAIANAIRALPLTVSPSTDIAPPREGEAK